MHILILGLHMFQYQEILFVWVFFKLVVAIKLSN